MRARRHAAAIAMGNKRGVKKTLSTRAGTKMKDDRRKLSALSAVHASRLRGCDASAEGSLNIAGVHAYTCVGPYLSQVRAVERDVRAQLAQRTQESIRLRDDYAGQHADLVTSMKSSGLLPEHAELRAVPKR